MMNLNQKQLEAVHFISGPLIIFAGAGTGKTNVIVHRIAYLLSLGISPSSILAVTFTNKAADEMKKRVFDITSQIYQNKQNVWISTFHSFCAHLLRIEAIKIKLNPNFLIYDFIDQKNMINSCIKDLNINEKKIKASAITNIISRAKDELKLPSDIMDDEAVTQNTFFKYSVLKIYDTYQKKMKKTGALDFGDLIMKTVTTFHKFPKILGNYQKKIKYVMVDEYQDTNHAQYVLIKLLTKKYSNLCVVGDDDQSIYSWRGADINNILNFSKDYPNAKSIKLEQNYRSTPRILSAAYNVIKHNYTRINKQLWTKNQNTGLVTVIKAADEVDEASKVANFISINSHKYELSKFAILYRTNAQSRVFEDALKIKKIPYTLIGTLKFYERSEIKDILAYLKIIHNPNDNISFKRIVNVPRRGIGKISIEKLEKFAFAKNVSLLDAISLAHDIDMTKKSLKALKSFAELISLFSKLKENNSVKTISKKIITQSGYLKELEIENTQESKIKIENIQE
ncbi:MAG: UvrD-helicase domain-containing protein, partial [Endomicrobium sp.]|nr:UvrD-helicase domain-containing protein [Endomicrobium sp.]